MSVKINGKVVAGKGVGVPKGGTTGQILSKSSATNYDTKWIDPPKGSSGITEAQVDAKISQAINDLIDGAPVAYDTLKEIGDKADKSSVPIKTSQLINDSGFITSQNLGDYVTTEELTGAIQEAIQATWEASY